MVTVYTSVMATAHDIHRSCCGFQVAAVRGLHRIHHSEGFSSANDTTGEFGCLLVGVGVNRRSWHMLLQVALASCPDRCSLRGSCLQVVTSSQQIDRILNFCHCRNGAQVRPSSSPPVPFISNSGSLARGTHRVSHHTLSLSTFG